MTEEEKRYVDQLISKALQVQTDEIEGQQVIDLNDLNICAVDYDETTTVDFPDIQVSDISILQDIYQDKDLIRILLSDPEEIPEIIPETNIGENVIIEFSEGTVKNPDPVIYEIKINPGDEITDGTIIGTVEQDGENKLLKSIFSKGRVKGVEDSSEFFHLYPSSCNRHIVLENTQPETGGDFDLSLDIQDLNDKFMNEGVLYALITNNMCQSLLPFILSRRYRGTVDSLFTNRNTTYQDSYIRSRVNSSDFSADNTEFKQEYIDIYGTGLNGLKIFDASVLQVINRAQEEFATKIIADDINQETMRNWKKRLKKKRTRKHAKKEINQKIEQQTNKIKKSENPFNKLNEEKDRLLNAREKYVNTILDIYKNKDKLPRCKYDEKYTDCKFLINDSIDGDVLKDVKKYDEEFTYSGIGEMDEYYNYYFSLLANINLSDQNDYTKEYYQIITDIIDKRMIVEGTEIKDIKLKFCQLFNDNVDVVFGLYTNSPLYQNNENYINQEFGKFENMVNSFANRENIKYSNNLKDEFTSKNLGEDAILNIGKLYTSDNQYKKVYDYIKSLFPQDKDDEETASDLIASQLATMYTYIQSYGDGSNNRYKDFHNEDGKYLYYILIKEEAEKIITFWDKVVDEYMNSDLNKCIQRLYEISSSYKEFATWPLPTDLTINNVNYKHYLFENVKVEKDDSPVDISIGDYSFPEKVDFPEIPDELDPISEEEALEKMNEHEIIEPKYDDVTILDFKYWQKYFALATLICLVPTFWNCGLDIMPWIQLIPMPCIFIALSSVYIPIFNLLIVFGISIRGMYPWPVILYLNTSDQPASILTPLISVLNTLRMALDTKLNDIQQMPIQLIVDQYINKLQKENNNLKKENKKLSTYANVLRNIKLPSSSSIQKEFASIVNPNIDTRQKFTRLEQLTRKQRVMK